MNDAGASPPAPASRSARPVPFRSLDDDDDDLLNSSSSRSCWLQLAEWRWVVCRGAGASAFVGTAIPDVAVLKIRQKVYEHRGGTGRSRWSGDLFYNMSDVTGAGRDNTSKLAIAWGRSRLSLSSHSRLGRQVSLTALPHNANFCPRRPLRTMSGHISRRQSPAPLCAGNGLGTGARDQHEVPSSDRVQNLQNSFSLGFHPRAPLTVGLSRNCPGHPTTHSIDDERSRLPRHRASAPACATWAMKRRKAI